MTETVPVQWTLSPFSRGRPASARGTYCENPLCPHLDRVHDPSIPLITCKSCRLAHYCNKECRRLSKDGHAVVCLKRSKLDDIEALVKDLVVNERYRTALLLADAILVSVARAVLHPELVEQEKERHEAGLGVEAIIERAKVMVDNLLASPDTIVDNPKLLGTFQYILDSIAMIRLNFQVPRKGADGQDVYPLPTLQPTSSGMTVGFLLFAAVVNTLIGPARAARPLTMLYVGLTSAPVSEAESRRFSFWTTVPGVFDARVDADLTSPRQLLEADARLAPASVYLMHLAAVDPRQGTDVSFVLWRRAHNVLVFSAIRYSQTLADWFDHNEQFVNGDGYAQHPMNWRRALDEFLPDLMKLTDEHLGESEREKVFTRLFSLVPGSYHRRNLRQTPPEGGAATAAERETDPAADLFPLYRLNCCRALLI